MKSIRQAKVWQKKVDYFNDAQVREIQIRLDGRYEDVKTKPVVALVKGNLALHTALICGDFDSQYFTITHLPTGVTRYHYVNREDLNSIDYPEMEADYHKRWLKYGKDAYPAINDWQEYRL